MIITKNHALAIPLGSLAPMTLRAVLIERDPNAKKLASTLRWELDHVRDILKRAPIPPFGGPPIAWITFDDIAGMSSTRARLLVECLIVSAFEGMNSYAASDLLGIPEREVRRTRVRIAEMLAPWLAYSLACQISENPHSPEALAAARLLLQIGSFPWKNC